MRISNGIQNRNRRMRNRTYGGVRGRKTKVGRKLLRFPPTRLKKGEPQFCAQQMLYVNESGSYALVLGSKLSTAVKFKNWVTAEVS